MRVLVVLLPIMLLPIMLMSVVADEAPRPPAPLKPAPNLSTACLLKTGPKHNSSFFHSKEAENILGSWGVLTGAPPEPFSMLAPNQASKGEYYMCREYAEHYNFWSVSVGVPESGYPNGGRRRRSGKIRDFDANEAYMAAVTDSLSAIAQHPADVQTKRRRLFGGYGGGGTSLGMCLPKECSEQDVKIITGYYWFWLKCGNIAASLTGGGGGGGGGVV